MGNHPCPGKTYLGCLAQPYGRSNNDDLGRHVCSCRSLKTRCFPKGPLSRGLSVPGRVSKICFSPASGVRALLLSSAAHEGLDRWADCDLSAATLCEDNISLCVRVIVYLCICVYTTAVRRVMTTRIDLGVGVQARAVCCVALSSAHLDANSGPQV